jgi:hypothetical protein
MTRLTIGLGFAAAIAVAVSAPVAGAETTGAVVPPENSAAAQYTEAIPTAGGEKQTHGSGQGNHRTPAQVIGANKAHKLQTRGKSGREVAAVVVATAPAASGGGRASEEGSAAGREPASAGNAHKGAGGQAASKGGESPRPASPQTQAATRSELPDGSSGIGETIAAATGSSSSGQLGALLPLAIAAAIAWSLFFFWRQRRQAE